jgi:hypothetical protein
MKIAPGKGQEKKASQRPERNVCCPHASVLLLAHAHTVLIQAYQKPWKNTSSAGSGFVQAWCALLQERMHVQRANRPQVVFPGQHMTLPGNPGAGPC